MRFSQNRIYCWAGMAYAGIAVFILLMFWLFTWMRKKTAENQAKYPPTYDCDALTAMFQDNNVLDQYASWASVDEAFTQNKVGTGAY